MGKLYTIEEIANILRVKRTTITKWIRDGKIRVNRLGGIKNVRITEEALNEFIKSTEV